MYVVSGAVGIDPGVTLTVASGTIVKFAQGASLNVNGTLNANASSSNPIYFTSIKDDTVGGDTNNDGTATMPSAANWEHIRIASGGTANFNNTIVRYGGRYVHWTTSSDADLYNAGGLLTIASSTIEYGVNGVHHKNGTTTITTSILKDFSGTGGLYKVDGAGSVSISSSTFKNAYYGVIFNSGGQLSVTNSLFTDNNVAMNIVTDAELTHSGNVASNNDKNGIEISGVTSSNQTWTADGLPYIATILTIGNGSVLTLDPGVVMKLNSSSHLTIEGTLNANGLLTNPVYFTSIKDDKVGGDTNNDSNATSPGSSDWENITVASGGTLNLKHSVVRYGSRYVHWSTSGDANIYNRGGILNIGTSTIAYGTHGINQENGTTTVWNSHLEHNTSGAAATNQVTATSSFMATNNYWGGGDTGPHHYAFNPNGAGEDVSDYIDFSPWMSHYLLRFEQDCIDLQPDTPNEDCNAVEDRELRWGWHASSTQVYTSELNNATTTWGDEGLVAIVEDQSTPTVELVTDDFDVPWRGAYYPPTEGELPGLIRLDTGKLDNDTFAGRQNTWTHELGHALGLTHSVTGNVLYSAQTQQTVLGLQDKSDYHYLWGF